MKPQTNQRTSKLELRLFKSIIKARVMRQVSRRLKKCGAGPSAHWPKNWANAKRSDRRYLHLALCYHRGTPYAACESKVHEGKEVEPSRLAYNAYPSGERGPLATGRVKQWLAGIALGALVLITELEEGKSAAVQVPTQESPATGSIAIRSGGSGLVAHG